MRKKSKKGSSKAKLTRDGHCCACFNLRKATRAVTQYFDEKMRETGLRATQLGILMAWVSPYWGHLIPGYETDRVLIGIVGDALFVASFFVLGGNFWDKVRALFVYEVRI